MDSLHIPFHQPDLAIATLDTWETIEVTGPDRFSFLHGLLTNKVKGTQPGDNHPHLYLTPKGRILGEVLATAQTDRMLLLVGAQQGEAFCQFLDHYQVLEDVAFTVVTERWTPILLLGQGIQSWCESQNLPYPEVSKGCEWAISLESSSLDVWSHRLALFGDWPACLLWAPKEHQDSLVRGYTQAGAALLDAATLSTLRAAGGWVDASPALVDLLVHEAGLEKTHVNFTKGCFVGQEVVARTEHRGKPNHALYWLHPQDESHSLPSTLLSSEEKLQSAKVIDEQENEIGSLRFHLRFDGDVQGLLACLKIKAMEQSPALFLVTEDAKKVPLQRIQFETSS